MKALIERWRRRSSAKDTLYGGDALARLLADYPPNRSCHDAEAEALTTAERDAGLEAFLAGRDERVRIVTDFLRGQGVDALSMMDAEADGLRATLAIDAWLSRVLPLRPMDVVRGDTMPNPPRQAFRHSDRSAGDLYFSLIADLALIEGEAIRIRDGRFSWRINRLPNFRDMPSYNRICLIKDGQPEWEATVLDMEDNLLAICHQKGSPFGAGRGHSYGEFLAGALRGGFDPL